MTVRANTGVTRWIAFEPLNIQLRGEGLPAGIFGFDLPPELPVSKPNKSPIS